MGHRRSSLELNFDWLLVSKRCEEASMFQPKTAKIALFLIVVAGVVVGIGRLLFP